MIIISNHGAKRVRERVGIKKCAVERHVLNVLERGTPEEYTSGRLRHWLDKKREVNDPDRRMWVYGDKVYVFREVGECQTLITVIQIPTGIVVRNVKSMQKLSKGRGKRRC